MKRQHGTIPGVYQMHETPLFSVTDKKFNVIILAAGKGTRLKPATDFIPKPLIKLGDERAIDYLLKKYQYVADRVIIGTGYEAELLENYVKGKYSAMEIEFSRENVDNLNGPGKSLVYALDHTSSVLPTIITFCDYIIGDIFSVDIDALGVSVESKESILGTYKTIVNAEEGVVQTLEDNTKSVKEYGFTGVAIFHNTLLLKAITYTIAAKGTIEYEAVIREYIKNIRTVVVPFKKIYEFGVAKTLEQTRKVIFNGHS